LSIHIFWWSDEKCCQVNQRSNIAIPCRLSIHNLLINHSR